MTNAVLEDLARLRRELDALGKMSVHVGVQGEEGSDLLTIAAVHEYGCTITVTPKMRGFFRGALGVNLRKTTERINIPERSFIRASFDAGQQELDRIVKRAIDKVITGDKTAQEAMTEIGLLAAQMTQNFINEGKVTPPDSQFTLDRKTQHTTLFDSGRLVNSITYRIEGGQP